MKLLFKLTAVVMMAGLAACQTTSPYTKAPPQAADPGPATMRTQTAPQSTSASASANATQQRPAQAQQQGQTQSSPVITLHLAQQQQEKPLVAVNVGAQKPLYALPRPVLTQTDIARVSPVSAASGNYLMLEMNERGIPKLDSITRQARGNYLLLSVQSQLVSVVQIGEVISDGRLLISTQSPQHTQAIIRLMQGKS